jgi:Ran GTPase-activating protein (RanGAP) involved in mRNA processing and transport
MGKLSQEVYKKAEVSEIVSFEEYNVTVPDLIKLFDNCLTKNRALRSLNLSNSSLGGFGISLVSQLVKSNSKLDTIILNNCGISTHDLEQFLKSVSIHPTSLREISLENNPFDENAIKMLTNYQQNHPNIKMHYPKTSVERNPEDIYASPFEDGRAFKGKYK